MKEQYKTEAELVASTMQIVNDICNIQIEREQKFVVACNIDIDSMYEEAQHIDAIVIDGVIRTREELLYRG